MLEQIFLKVLDMSRAASMVIVIVLIVRILLKRFPKYISYMLWSVVLFRLLCPVTLESEISLMPSLTPVLSESAPEKGTSLPEGAGESTGLHADSETKTGAETARITPIQFSPAENTGAVKVSPQKLFIVAGKYVWISGIGILFLYCVISAIKIRSKVLISIPLKENIYITDESISPFVMGIFHPRIYLPGCLSGAEQDYIILHEKFHIRRFDHIVKPAAFAALAIHWFNPLVWITFILFCKDMEMSCDEAVIKKMGEHIRADYSASLLALSTPHRIIRGIPVDFGKGDTKERVKNLAAFRKTGKGVSAVLIAGVVILIICLMFTRKPLVSTANDPKNKISAARNHEIPHDIDHSVVSLNIAEHYITHKGDPSNLYFIDGNNVLWGSGRNEYGQLGQGTQDYEFYSEMVKIAENTVHIDYSQKGFVIFLTKDHRLYGMGNAGCGALQQYAEFDWVKYTNGELAAVTSPILLMEDVVYACCGRDDIVCLKEDGTVWTWGTIYVEGGYLSQNVSFTEKPEKILENAVMVTGGWFNHAALLQDGTVWTWGYNIAGNCGIEKPTVVSTPAMASENAVMVWTDLAIAGYPQPDTESTSMAWTGNLKYHTEYQNIAEFEDIYPKYLNNTVIQKADGSYWVCGENVGAEEKTVAGSEGNYTVICTHEFFPCE